MDPKTPTFDVALKSTERQWVQKIPEVYTNDLGSVSLQFRITDCTDTELTGSTAIVLLKMRDGSFFQGPSTDVTRTLNVFSYTLKENEGNHDGLAEIQLIVTIDTKEFATQKYNFKVITGLDSEVAREIMIYDWSTLTREARAYIDEFTADELLRDAEFDNAQFDRNVAFNAAQGQRTTDFRLAQTQRNTDFVTDQAQRVSDFNAAEAARVLAFNNAETDRAKASLNKLMALDARTEFEMKNLGINTYPLSDTTGWGSNTGVTNITAESGVISGLMTNGFFITNVNNFMSTPNAIGDKIYSCGKVQAVTKVDSGNISSVKLHDTEKPMVYDTWIALSGIKTYAVVLSYVAFQFVSSEYATAAGRTIKVKDAVHINLTKTFGAGKEPTLAEMDRLMARFPNSWFDGVKPIQTIETLYQEKANKAQEAWITPTLINGWIAYDVNRTPKIRKDEFGKVTLKGMAKSGTVGQSIFVLPVGYRPAQVMIVSSSSANATITITIYDTGHFVFYSGSNASVSLENISFFID